MKNLKDIISEKLIINKNTKINIYHYYPKTLNELKIIVNKLIKERGVNADLNDIDTSKITDMNRLFYKSKFNGDISEWDVSHVTNMIEMFSYSEFTGKNGDISNWNTKNVEKMSHMFDHSLYNGNISKWNVKNVKHIWMINMFDNSPLEKNPPKWYKN